MSLQYTVLIRTNFHTQRREPSRFLQILSEYLGSGTGKEEVDTGLYNDIREGYLYEFCTRKEEGVHKENP